MSWELLIVLFFLIASTLLYVIFGGADFGAGVIEAFTAKTHRVSDRKLINKAMAPVWEANHIWLILLIVILFMAFPPVYNTILTYIYLPTMALLVGIVFRGCAFTFRYYDEGEKNFENLYSAVFYFSSLAVPFSMGLAVGSLSAGRIDPTADSYYDLFIAPWLNSYSFATAVFTVCLFSFIASVYLVGEAKEVERRYRFARKARITMIALLLSGGIVLLTAKLNEHILSNEFLRNPASLSCFLIATLLVPTLWSLLKNPYRRNLIRVLGVAITAFVVLGWFGAQFPAMIHFRSSILTIVNSAAPIETLRALAIALVIGSVLIFPAFFYLMKIFKKEIF